MKRLLYQNEIYTPIHTVKYTVTKKKVQKTAHASRHTRSQASTSCPVAGRGCAKQAALKACREERLDTSVHTAREKICGADMHTGCKTKRGACQAMDETVTTSETEAIVKTLSNRLIRMKSRCRTRKRITRYQRRRLRHLVTLLL